VTNIELTVFPDAEALARATAAQWLEEVCRAQAGGGYCVALSGGRSAAGFFAAAARLAGAGDHRLTRARFFWADERCVPPDHPESNYGLARQCLLEPLDIPASRIHRLRGEIEPALAAQEAEAVLRAWAPPDAEGRPALDLVLLGMGEDGHVASLFPDAAPEVVRSQAFYLPVVGPKPPPRRLSLSYRAIAAARQVWVLASGPGKEEALRESLSPQGRTPLGRVLQSRPRTLILTDIALGG
jgi:6-phosphogluconolactonase